SDRDAVGDALGGDAGGGAGDVGGVGVKQHVWELGWAIAVLEPRVAVHAHHLPFDLHQPVAEPPERLQRPGVRRPRRRVALPEVHLVGGVLGQDLDQRDADDGLELAGDGADEGPLRVAPQLAVRLRPGLRHPPPAHRRPVREVTGVRVLAEVDRRVQRRRDPDDGGARVAELRHGVHPGPPRRALEVAVPDLPHLRPPRLQLRVASEHAVVGVVDRQVLAHPLLDRVPDLQPVRRVRVVLDQQPHLVRARRVLHRHSPA
ncbi:Os03g0700450, partial [Oryza sativa Japonica Group]